MLSRADVVVTWGLYDIDRTNVCRAQWAEVLGFTYETNTVTNQPTIGADDLRLPKYKLNLTHVSSYCKLKIGQHLTHLCASEYTACFTYRATIICFQKTR